jgi:hypothetical protein
MKMNRFAVIALAALGALLTTAPDAQADTNCTETFTTFQSMTGNLNVPNNATCILSAGASVTGNTTVGNGATLLIQSGTVAGNVQGNNCGFVGLINVTVGGSVQIGNCRGTNTYPYAVIVDGSTIGGDFQCHNNTVDQYACVLLLSHIIGNVQVMNNVSSLSFPPLILGNRIAKNLQCQNNIAAPTNGSIPNTVSGNPNQSSEGQCKGL